MGHGERGHMAVPVARTEGQARAPGPGSDGDPMIVTRPTQIRSRGPRLDAAAADRRAGSDMLESRGWARGPGRRPGDAGPALAVRVSRVESVDKQSTAGRARLSRGCRHLKFCGRGAPRPRMDSERAAIEGMDGSTCGAFEAAATGPAFRVRRRAVSVVS
jgi:hypothetical protein